VGFPKDDLRTILRRLTSVHDENVVWDGEPEPFILPIPGEYVGQLTLSVVATQSRGTPDIVRDFTASSETMIGHRIATVSMRLELFGSQEAYDELDLLRLRLMRPSVRAELRDDAGLALVDSPSITTLDGTVDNRATSAAILDVRFAYAITDVLGPDEGEPGFIESIEDPEEDLGT